MKDDEYIYCSKCPENGRGGDKRNRVLKEEREVSNWGNFVCVQCKNLTITLELLDYIKSKISISSSEDEGKGELIVRELIQNADDAKAEIIVLRFEDDALYVANDGREFTQENADGAPGDMERITKILSRPKQYDKETAGHFGSGFQTVYALTNMPEVHSAGESFRMNPITRQCTSLDGANKRTSPFRNEDRKGVLFRFPWRDDTAAESVIEGGKYFEDTYFWPRWNREQRRSLFNDLVGYVHQAILCCQNLKIIRLICNLDGDFRAYQVERNFTLRDVDVQNRPENRVKQIKEGLVSINKSWDSSFRSKECTWIECEVFPYYIDSCYVRKLSTKKREPLYIGRNGKSIEIVTKPYELEKQILKNHIHLLLPLFDTSILEKKSSKWAGGTYPLYSVIPLPTKSKNRFAFSCHFSPTEDRKDVNVEEGPLVEWYIHSMNNVAQLYIDTFPSYLRTLQGIIKEPEVAQKIIINSIPGSNLRQWMRPDKSQERFKNQDWWNTSWNHVISTAIYNDILFSCGEWVRPVDAFLVEPSDPISDNIIVMLGKSNFTASFVNHPHFWVMRDALAHRKFDGWAFLRLWKEFVSRNADRAGTLRYGQPLNGGGILDGKSVENLIRYCVPLLKRIPDLENIKMVPDSLGNMKSLKEFSNFPPGLEIIEQILPPEQLVHKDVKTLVKDALPTVEIAIALRKLSDAIASSNRFKDMNSTDHALISRILKGVVFGGNTPALEVIKDLYIIPYRLRNCVIVGTPNKDADGSLIGDRDEDQTRDCIFYGKPRQFPGMTDEVRKRIKFLDVADCNDKELEKISKYIQIVPLYTKQGGPLNFIRHFLSNKHGTLFDENNLKAFLGNSDRELLRNQRKDFQLALREYFTGPATEHILSPKQMGDVPCLYDQRGEWRRGKDFSIVAIPELGISGSESLHSDLKAWPKQTLKALGVSESPRKDRVLERVQQLLKEQDRKGLANMVAFLLTTDLEFETEDGTLTRLELLDLPWIPSLGGYKTPQDAVLPTKRNVGLVGPKHPGFFDIDICTAKLKEAVISGMESDKLRLPNVGMAVSPSNETLLTVLRGNKSKLTPPPQNLFDELNARLQKNAEAFEGLAQENGYYNEKWWDTKAVFLSNGRERIADVVTGMFLFVMKDNKHADFLQWDGASTSNGPQFALRLADAVIAGTVRPTDEVWDTFEACVADLDDAAVSGLKTMAKYGVAGKPVKPTYIVFDPLGLFANLVEVKNHVIAGGDVQSRHGRILKKLGALSTGEMDETVALDLLRGITGPNALIDYTTSNAILKIIKRTFVTSGKPLPDECLWPSLEGWNYRLIRLKDGYVMDSPEAFELREGRFHFLLDEIDRNRDQPLREFALTNGAMSFKKDLEIILVADCEATSKPDNGQTSRFRETASALALQFPSERSSFDWLRTIEVKRCRKIVVRYELRGEPSSDIAANAFLTVAKAGPVLYVKRDATGIAYKEITDSIIKQCLYEQFPECNVDKLESIVYKLITIGPESWHIIVPGYQYRRGEPIEPIVDEGIEGSGEGYLEAKERLQRWYGSCQICGSVTPMDTGEDFETSEKLKSVVSLRGGLLIGEMERYEIGNSVLLCPRHHALFERGLIRFPDIELNGHKAELTESIDKKIKEFEEGRDPEDEIMFGCEVFEGIRKDGVGRADWTDEHPMVFKVDHFIPFLENIRDYLQDQLERDNN